MNITRENNRELYDILCGDCDFDTDHVPKHGKGEIVAYAEHEDQKYMCYAEWDYSWGVEWYDGYYEWQPVDEIIKECPCCGKPID